MPRNTCFQARERPKSSSSAFVAVSSRTGEARRLNQAGLRPLRSANARQRIFGLDISDQSMASIVHEILQPLPSRSGVRLVATVNVDHVVTLRDDERFRQAYANAWRVTIDGAPVFVYAKAAGLNVRERVTGSDLFAKLVENWRPAEHRLYMLVCSEEAASRMRSHMQTRGFADSNLFFEVPPFGFEEDAFYNSALAKRIRERKPTHLVMGVGAPKSEIWAHEHRSELGDVIVLCVGAAIEFVTGLKKRSPIFMQRIGLEWLWRFGTEPRRLFHRYFIRSIGFLFAIAVDRRDVSSSASHVE